MKRETYEKWILLDQAGNLPARKKATLEEALKHDVHLQAYRQSLDILSTSTLPEDESPGLDSANILRYARRSAETKDRESFFTLWQPAIGYAAIAVALGMVTYYYFKHDPQALRQTVHTQPDVSHAEWMSWEAPYEEDLVELKSEFRTFQNDIVSDTLLTETTRDLATTLLIYGESS